MSVKWQTGPRRPIKKIPRYIWAVLSMLYIMSWHYAIIHATEKSLSGIPSSDLPVIVIIGVLVVVGWVARAKQARRDRERNEGIRRHVARKYPGVR